MNWTSKMLQERITNWKSMLIIYGVYTVITIFVTFPAASGLVFPYTIPGDHYDSKYFLWHLWWTKVAILNLGVSPTFTKMIFYPLGGEVLLASPFNELVSVSLQPLFGLTRVYTMLWFFAFPTTALTTYLLGTLLTQNRWAGFIGGVIFSFSAYHYAHGMHLGLWTLQWLPLYALSLYLLLNKFSVRRAVLVVVSFVLAVMSEHVYYMLYFVLPFTTFFLLYHWAKKNSILRQRKYQVLLAGIFTIGFLLIIPVYLHLLPKHNQDYIDKSSEVISGSADVLGYLLPAPQNPIWWDQDFSQNVYERIRGVVAEDVIFIGYMALILAVLGSFVWTAKERKFWIWLGLIACIFSLGPVLQVYGPLQVTIGESKKYISLPYVLVQKLPFIGLLRAPARLSVMVQLSVAMLATFGFSRISDFLSTKWRILGVAVLTVIILTESLYKFPYPVFSAGELSPPEIYKIISRQNDDSAILDVPSRTLNRSREINPKQISVPTQAVNKGFTFDSMYFSTTHHHPLVWGETARTPVFPGVFIDTTSFIRELMYPTGVLDNDWTITSTNKELLFILGSQLLSKHNIGYVIIHRNRMHYYAPPERRVPELMLQETLGPPFYEEEGVIAFKVTPREFSIPARELVILGDGWYPKIQLYNRPVQAMLKTGSIYFYEPEAKRIQISMNAFAFSQNYNRVNVLVNNALIDTLTFGTNPESSDTQYTRVFKLPAGFSEVNFQVDTGTNVSSFDTQIYLGVYNITRYDVLSIEDVLPTTNANINFGNEIELIGFNQNSNTVHHGETLRLTLFWHALNTVSDNYKVLLQVEDLQGQIIYQHNVETTLPLTEWESDKVILDKYEFSIPPELPPGEYKIFVGLYSIDTSVRLNVISDWPHDNNRILLSRAIVTTDK